MVHEGLETRGTMAEHAHASQKFANRRTPLPATKTQRSESFDPVTAEGRRLQCFTVRGRPFIASSAQLPNPAMPIGTRTDIWSAIDNLHVWRHSVVTRPWQAGLRSSEVVARNTQSKEQGRAELLCNSLLRIYWQGDDEWPWAAVFRNTLLNASCKPGLSDEAMQEKLTRCEQKLVHAMHCILNGRLWRRFRSWRRRAARRSCLKRLVLWFMRLCLDQWRRVAWQLGLRRAALLHRLRLAWWAWRQRRAVAAADARVRCLCTDRSLPRGALARGWWRWRAGARDRARFARSTAEVPPRLLTRSACT